MVQRCRGRFCDPETGAFLKLNLTWMVLKIFFFFQAEAFINWLQEAEEESDEEESE